MDFNVIRRSKQPPKKPDPPPPKGPPPPPPPAPAPPPPPPPPPPHPYGAFAAHLDELSRMEQLRSVEFSNSKMMKLNYGELPNQQFGSYEYRHLPVGGLGSGFGGGSHSNYDHHHHHHRPPHMALHPPQENRHALPGPPLIDYHHHGPPGGAPPLGLPQPGYQHGPPPPPNMQQYCDMFSDENANACMIM